MTKLKEQNLYWLAGEKCFVLHRKNELLNALHKQTGFQIKHVPECQTFNALASHLYSKDLFDDGNFIYVYDGKIPEPIITSDRLKNHKTKSIYVFITEDDFGKNNTFNKTFSNFLEYFEPLKDSDPSKTSLSKAIKNIKKITKWNGDDELISHLLTSNKFDCGLVLNEINKIRNYNIEKEDRDINLKNSSDIMFSVKNIKAFDFAKLVYFRKKHIINDLEEVLVSCGTIGLSQILLEGYTFILLCRMALDRNLNEYNAIQEIADLTGKNSNNIRWRYDGLKPVVQKLDIIKLSKIIETIDKSIKEIILHAQDSTLIVKRMIFKIFSIY